MDVIKNVIYFAVFSLVITIMIYSLFLVSGIVRGIIYTQRCQNETIEFETKRFQLYSSIDNIYNSVNIFLFILHILLYIAVIIGSAYFLNSDNNPKYNNKIYIYAYPVIMVLIPIITAIHLVLNKQNGEDEPEDKPQDNAYFYIIPFLFIPILGWYYTNNTSNTNKAEDTKYLAVYYYSFVFTGLFLINVLNFFIINNKTFTFNDLFKDEESSTSTEKLFQRRFWIMLAISIILHIWLMYINKNNNNINTFTFALLCAFIIIFVISSIIQTLTIEFYKKYSDNIKKLQIEFNKIGNRNNITYLNDIEFDNVLKDESSYFVEDNKIEEFIKAFQNDDSIEKKKDITDESDDKNTIINTIKNSRNIYGKLYNIHNIYIKLTKKYEVVEKDTQNSSTESYEIIAGETPNNYESTFIKRYRERIAEKIKKINHNCDKSIPVKPKDIDEDIDKANFINFILCSGDSVGPIMTPTKENIEEIVQIFREFKNEFNKTHTSNFDKYVINNYNASHNNRYKCTSIVLDSEGKIDATNPNEFELNGCCYFPFFENDPDKFKTKLETFNINADDDVMNDIQKCLQVIHHDEQEFANYQIITIFIILAVFSLVFCASYFAHKNIESTIYPKGILVFIVLMMFAITVMTIVYNIRDGIN
jgi:hypothetical protein